MDDLKSHIENLPKKNYFLNISNIYKSLKNELSDIIKKRTVEEFYKTHILISHTKKNYLKKYYTVKKFTSNLYLIIYTEDIFIGGHYKKLSRNISQTKSSFENVSIEEIFFNYLRKFGEGYFIFSGVGREDVDVQQLGGRKFFIRIKNAKFSNFDFLSENFIFETVEFSDLKITDKKRLQYYMEQKFTKKYKIVLLSEKEIHTEQVVMNKKYIVHQKTPLRVLHRRSNMVRSRYIYIRSIRKIDQLAYELIVETEAGLYVKEFIHGDFNRSVTFANLFNFSFKMELKSLDVLKIYY